MTGDLRVVREKVDETNVRLDSLSQEVEALRLAQAAAPAGAPCRRAAADPAAAARPPPGARRRPPPPGRASGPRRRRPSRRPGRTTTPGSGAWPSRASRATSRRFPKSDLADDAQYYIGETYYSPASSRRRVAGLRPGDRALPASNTLPGRVLQARPGAEGARARCRRRGSRSDVRRQDLSRQRRGRSPSRPSTSSTADEVTTARAPQAPRRKDSHGEQLQQDHPGGQPRAGRGTARHAEGQAGGETSVAIDDLAKKDDRGRIETEWYRIKVWGTQAETSRRTCSRASRSSRRPAVDPDMERP